MCSGALSNDRVQLRFVEHIKTVSQDTAVDGTDCCSRSPKIVSHDRVQQRFMEQIID